jgi:hypothetical protein
MILIYLFQADRMIYFITFFVLVTRVSGSTNEGPPHPHDDNEWKTGVIFCVLGGVVFLIGLGLRYLWLSYLRGEPRRMIERLPSLEFFSGAVGAFETTHCGICQMELVEGDSLRMLPCTHIFHTQCLVDMVALGRRADCPECRRTFGIITPPDPEVPWTSSLAQLG